MQRAHDISKHPRTTLGEGRDQNEWLRKGEMAGSCSVASQAVPLTTSLLDLHEGGTQHS